MNEIKKEKIQELKNRIENSINEYPEAWVVTVGATAIIIASLKKHKKNKMKNKGVIVTTTPNQMFITNHTGKTIVYDVLRNGDCHSYFLHLA